ncbi:MAG TPA: MFS transporter [Actinomycetota bacterium]
MEPPEAFPPVPRPARSKHQVLSLLRRNGDFRLLFFGQVVSFTGDWFLFVALAGLVYSLTKSPALVAAVYASLTVPFAVFSFIGGPLADRLNRQLLMITADALRGILCFGFFFIHHASQVWMVYVLSGAITALGAVFEPASMAAIPNLVEREDLAIANVMAGATWGTMLAIGSAVGGLVVAAFGRDAGYMGDAASFFVSAILVAQIRRPFAEPREPHHEHPGMFEATREAVRYARQDKRVLALLTVKGGFGMGGGVVALLPVLAFTVFKAGDGGTGILYGFRGLGVLIGPFLARRFIRDDNLEGLFWGISISFALYGACYAFVPWMPVILLSGALVLVGHLGGGAQWTLSSYGLQVIVPDHIRGRIFAFDEAFITTTLAVSATVAGLISDVVDVRVVMLGLAGVTLSYSVIWTIATRKVRRSLRPEPERSAA